VERGPAVYLSGLREKYFGEVFLNASNRLEGLLSAGIPNSVVEESGVGLSGLLETTKSIVDENPWSFENVLPNKFRQKRATNEEGLNHIARYVESFESRSNEIWLVFRHEGVSLSKLLYTVEGVDDYADGERVEQVKHVQILRPSKWWHWLKTTEAGQEEMRSLLWQLVCLRYRFQITFYSCVFLFGLCNTKSVHFLGFLFIYLFYILTEHSFIYLEFLSFSCFQLMGIKSCHERNITHRDIKPGEDISALCLSQLSSKMIQTHIMYIL
jgi:serine/threonine protein kinase